MNAPLQTLRFAGAVRLADGPGRGGITLLGRLATGADGGPVQLSVVCRERPQLPAELLDPTFEATPPQVLLRAGSREWRLPCVTWQLHQDAGARFYTAVPPRPTPWRRRVSWRVLLGLAGTPVGRWLLSRKVK